VDKFQNKFYRALTESDGLAKLPPYVRLGARGNDRKNMRQVPEIHRARPDLNNKVENVRSTGNTRPLSVVDVEDIMRRYHISSLQRGESKNLGNTKMIITRSMVGTYTLHS